MAFCVEHCEVDTTGGRGGGTGEVEAERQGFRCSGKQSDLELVSADSEVLVGLGDRDWGRGWFAGAWGQEEGSVIREAVDTSREDDGFGRAGGDPNGAFALDPGVAFAVNAKDEGIGVVGIEDVTGEFHLMEKGVDGGEIEGDWAAVGESEDVATFAGGGGDVEASLSVSPPGDCRDAGAGLGEVGGSQLEDWRRGLGGEAGGEEEE